MTDHHRSGGLRAERLRCSFGTTPVLREASLDVRPGQVTALVGPNGSGKSTLLRTMARLHRPDAGDVHFDDGSSALLLSAKAFARAVTLLTQSRPTPNGIAVRDVVAYGRHPHRRGWQGGDPHAGEAIRWALDVTGITGMADRGVDELSGGERQRVWLATCLCQQTSVLLLDEPTTYLDLRYQVEILDLIRDLADDHGVAVGVVLHDPAIVRLAASRSPNLLRHRLLVVLAAMAGVVVVLGSDIAMRAVLGANRAVEVPAGVVTTTFGAAVLVVLARRHRDSGPQREAPGASTSAARSSRRFWIVLVSCVAALLTVVVAGLLLGGTMLLTGDVWAWLQGDAGRRTTFLLDERVPRVGASVLAGAALALAGTAVQAVGRNPLAEPSVLGLTAGAGVGAVGASIVVGGDGVWTMAAAAAFAATATFTVVYRLGWKDGLHPDRLLLIGIGMTALLQAAMVVLLLTTDPWNTPRALTWLSGSTYGRQLDHLLPAAVALATGLPLLLANHRSLDLLALDDDAPRILGVRLERTRALILVGVVVLTAAAVTAIGVVAFVGLVAPHAARALVGGQHRRVLVVAPLIGAGLVGVADAVGRTVIAPAQVPAGLVTALVGTPYFAWLLWRSRTI